MFPTAKVNVLQRAHTYLRETNCININNNQQQPHCGRQTTRVNITQSARSKKVCKASSAQPTAPAGRGQTINLSHLISFFFCSFFFLLLLFANSKNLSHVLGRDVASRGGWVVLQVVRCYVILLHSGRCRSGISSVSCLLVIVCLLLLLLLAQCLFCSALFYTTLPPTPSHQLMKLKKN